MELNSWSTRSVKYGGALMIPGSRNGDLETRTTPSSPSPPPLGLKEDTLFVAMGKEEKESTTVLMWALHKSAGKKIGILHIHQPAERIPMGITIVSKSMLQEIQVKAYHDKERQEMHKMMDSFAQTCETAGVEVEKLYKENSCIEKGIVELIAENGIKRLVMGGAASKYFSKKMKEPKSTKANYVRREAPGFCHIWFVCKGNLIHTRASKSNTLIDEFQGSPNSSCTSVSPSSAPWRSCSSSDVENSPVDSQNAVVSYHRVMSEKSSVLRSPLSQHRKLDWERISSPTSPTIVSQFSPSCSLNETDEDHEIPLPPATVADEDEIKSLTAEAIGNGLYDRLQDIVTETETYKKEAYEESIKRKKAEKDVIEAMLRVKAAETMHSEKIRCLEEALSKSRGDVENARLEHVGVMNKLKHAQELNFSLKSKVAESDWMVEELEKKMYSAVDLLQKYKLEKDELRVERDDALKEDEELRKKHSEESSLSNRQFFLEFSFPEIKEATNNFSSSCKIGEGGYGAVYLATLRHTKVAIKKLKPSSEQGPLEFQQEVSILSKLRHPNIVTLIGACPEACALIYEYVPGGNLEERLNCEDNSPPLTWKTRICIASELCSTLIFLHSCLPQGVVHGDLKPSNVLLDGNYVSKLCDFGICRELPRVDSENATTRCFWLEQPMGTRAYIPPEVLQYGELTTRSDVYSFGVILLRLLSGKPAKGLSNEIEAALRNGNLKDVLDPTAGDWPFVQAEQLARLAIRCTNSNSKNRPNLASEVWRVLEPMKVSCGASSGQIPSYFVCPIFQEIMRDPVVAGDGFTYESEAIKGWLENGHNTSPTTNSKLPHMDLVPNHALRSAIQEWLQRQ